MTAPFPKRVATAAEALYIDMRERKVDIAATLEGGVLLILARGEQARQVLDDLALDETAPWTGARERGSPVGKQLEPETEE